MTIKNIQANFLHLSIITEFIQQNKDRSFDLMYNKYVVSFYIASYHIENPYYLTVILCPNFF